MTTFSSSLSDFIVFCITFWSSFKSFVLHPIVISIFVVLSMLFIFLQIANTLFKRKNDVEFSFNFFVDLPKIFTKSMLSALFFISCLCVMIYFRDASQLSYEKLNKYLASNFGIEQLVPGSVMGDNLLKPVHNPSHKAKMRQSVSKIYMDKEISFADLMYIEDISSKYYKKERAR